MNRKQLEECAWSKTPTDERRAQKDHYDWKTKKTTTKKLKGNEREVRVFDPSGHTPGSMSPFVPLWSLYSDELEQRCKDEVEPKLRAPYNRARADYTGDVESNPGNRATAEGISSARRHAVRRMPSHASKRSVGNLYRVFSFPYRKDKEPLAEFNSLTAAKAYVAARDPRKVKWLKEEALYEGDTSPRTTYYSDNYYIEAR